MVSSSIPRIAIIVASTRGQRFADHPLGWLIDRLGARTDLTVDVLDLREHPLPFYDLPTPPAMAERNYTTEEERALGEILDGYDGYLVLTNEFNHGYSAALKNVLDHYFAEFRHKPMGFAGYGNVGGSRAIEQLRQVAAELDMVSVRHSVHIFGAQMAQIRRGEQVTRVFSELEPRLDMLIDDLLWWARALREARTRDEGLALSA